ncbi:MAG: pyrimidine 5'-nucleotidase [Burkholderiaceae bacterium]
MDKTGARLVWFFDLDDTLHEASHAIFAAIDRRMTEYVARHLDVDEPEADRLRLTYWRRYGATMLGLMRHHAVDPHHFLRETHDFDVAALLRAERGLARLFARLPGRKVLLTNAPDRYARAVLRELALRPHVRARYTIERMRVHGVYRPKPSRAMLRRLLAFERIRAHRAVLVDDSPTNLKAARAVGLRTVLVQRRRAARSARGQRRADYVGLRVGSVLDLPKRLAFLRK